MNDTKLRGEAWLTSNTEKVLGDAAKEAEFADQIPEGRYAIQYQSKSWRFFVVQKGKEGSKWEGYTFLKLQVSDELYPVQPAAYRIELYKAILEMGIAKSMMKYGIEIGVCSVCGRTLTDEQSRQIGIGPICIDRFAEYL